MQAHKYVYSGLVFMTARFPSFQTQMSTMVFSSYVHLSLGKRPHKYNTFFPQRNVVDLVLNMTAMGAAVPVAMVFWITAAE